jgi:hypothetical protein
LDRRADEQDMSWKRQADNIYLFRNNRWYRDDELEVPNTLLQRWMVEFARQDHDRPQLAFREAPLPHAYAQRVLNLRAEMVSMLTPWQLANGLKFFSYRPQADVKPLPFGPDGPPTLAAMGAHVRLTRASPAKSRPEPEPRDIQFPFFALADTLLGDHNTLRFYAGLSEEQRTALLAGQLPYTGLDAGGQQMARYLAPMLPFALQQAQVSNQPVMLSLESRISGGFGGMGVEMERVWLERSGLGRLMLGITSPALFVNDDVRRFAP